MTRKRLFILGLSSVLILAFVLGVSGLNGPSVKGRGGYISISVGTVLAAIPQSSGQSGHPQNQIDLTPATLDIRFEPSGTHVDSKGNLKIRLDFYPTPNSKSYASQHVEVVDEKSAEFQKGYPGEVDKDGNPVDEKAYQTWLDSLPKLWVTNPCLSHLMAVKPDITQADLDAIAKSLFTGDVTATIDDASVQANYAHLISPYMRDKSSATLVKMWDDAQAMTPILADLASRGMIQPTKAILTVAKSDPTTKLKVEDAIVADLNSRLADYVVVGEKNGATEPIKSGSIDVGPGATNRSGTLTIYSSGTRTIIEKGNPANTTGSLDTGEIWLLSKIGTANFFLGTYSEGASNVLTCRDSESIGDVPAGSKQTYTGLTITVNSGDYLGTGSKSGTEITIEHDNTGGSGIWYKSGEYLDPTDSATFTSYANYVDSLYATGTEGASGPTVVTGSASNITTTTASTAENVTATTSNVTSWGTQYGTTVSYGANVTNSGNQTAAFGWTDNLTGLSANTTYHYRGFATNSGGTGYGSDQTFTTLSLAMTNTPSSKAFGVVLPSTTYYAKGAAPSNPVVDGDCSFTITNTGTAGITTTIKSTNPTGGAGWTLTSGAPGSDTIRLTAYYSGENPASGVVLTTSDQSFTSSIAASGTKLWDFKLETGTFTDGAGKTWTITITAAEG